MEEIVFVTHNKGKIASAQKQLAGVNVKIFEYELDEPRSDDIKFISKAKVEEAYKLVKKPCISLDCGFWRVKWFPTSICQLFIRNIRTRRNLKINGRKRKQKLQVHRMFIIL